MDLPKLMSMFPTGNAELPENERNPFDEMLEQENTGYGQLPSNFWSFAAVDKKAYAPIFQSLHPREGVVPGASIRPVLMESGVPNDQLAHIWRLSDWDADGYMDVDEFSVAMHLIRAVQNGVDLPEKLPSSLMPSRKI